MVEFINGLDAMPTIAAIDVRLSKKLAIIDRQHVEGTKAVLTELGIGGSRWPRSMRVMRTLDMSNGEYLERIKWLQSGKGITKVQIVALLSVPGVASRLLDENFLSTFEWIEN